MNSDDANHVTDQLMDEIRQTFETYQLSAMPRPRELDLKQRVRQIVRNWLGV